MPKIANGYIFCKFINHNLWNFNNITLHNMRIKFPNNNFNKNKKKMEEHPIYCYAYGQPYM